MTPPRRSPPSDQKRASSTSTRAKENPPEYDPLAVGRIAQRVSLVGIELVGSHFERFDRQALQKAAPRELTPEIGMDVDWRVSQDRSHIGCLVTFGTVFRDRAPYDVVAEFRLTYGVDGSEPLRRSDVEQFATWNAVFNAWPYWREFLSSTINRAQLPRFVLPVMRVPRVS